MACGDTRPHGDDSGVHVDQRERITRIHRQIEHGLRVERDRAIRRLRVEHGHRGRHLDGLANLADSQLQIQLERLVDAKFSRSLNCFLEARRFR